MEYTAQQSPLVKQEFAIRRKRQILLAIPLVAMALFVGLLEDKAGNAVMGISTSVIGPVFAVLVVGAIGFSLRNWRCPACNGYLGKRLNPHFCVKCGAALQ